MSEQIQTIVNTVNEARSLHRDLVSSANKTYSKEKAVEVIREGEQTLLNETEQVLRDERGSLTKKSEDLSQSINDEMFPLLKTNGYETPGEKMQRETALAESFRVAYSLPPFDLGALRLLFAQGLMHTAFLYTERMETEKSGDPKYLQWETGRNQLVDKYSTVAQKQRDLKRITRDVERIDELLAAVKGKTLFSTQTLVV